MDSFQKASNPRAPSALYLRGTSHPLSLSQSVSQSVSRCDQFFLPRQVFGRKPKPAPPQCLVPAAETRNFGHYRQLELRYRSWPSHAGCPTVHRQYSQRPARLVFVRCSFFPNPANAQLKQFLIECWNIFF